MFKKIIASFLATVFFAGVAGSIAGCNTVEGLGKDIQRSGTAIKDEANERRR